MLVRQSLVLLLVISAANTCHGQSGSVAGLSLRSGCLDNNGGCQHICTTNVFGQPECSCTLTYQLAGDKKSCVDMCDEPTNELCNRNCNEDQTVCWCGESDLYVPSLYRCVDKCSVNNGYCPGDQNCKTVGDKVTCLCDSSTTSSATTQNFCITSYTCDQRNCEDKCIDLPLPIEDVCYCDAGKVVNPNDQTSCLDTYDVCSNVTCGAGEQCEIGKDDVATCTCKTGFKLVTETNTCVNGEDIVLDCVNVTLENGQCGCSPSDQFALDTDLTSCLQCYSNCNIGQYDTASCTGSDNSTCADCSVCTENTYTSKRCSGVIDTRCTTCTVCKSDEYIENNCTSTSNTVCKKRTVVDSRCSKHNEATPYSDAICTECAVGFTNLDNFCRDIAVDKCKQTLTPCGENANCVNLPGYTNPACVCKDGFFGNGTICNQCSDEDRCSVILQPCLERSDVTCSYCENSQLYGKHCELYKVSFTFSNKNQWTDSDIIVQFAQTVGQDFNLIKNFYRNYTMQEAASSSNEGTTDDNNNNNTVSVSFHVPPQFYRNVEYLLDRLNSLFDINDMRSGGVSLIRNGRVRLEQFTQLEIYEYTDLVEEEFNSLTPLPTTDENNGTDSNVNNDTVQDPNTDVPDSEAGNNINDGNIGGGSNIKATIIAVCASVVTVALGLVVLTMLLARHKVRKNKAKMDLDKKNTLTGNGSQDDSLEVEYRRLDGTSNGAFSDYDADSSSVSTSNPMSPVSLRMAMHNKPYLCTQLSIGHDNNSGGRGVAGLSSSSNINTNTTATNTITALQGNQQLYKKIKANYDVIPVDLIEKTNMIGKGAFSHVYRGAILDKESNLYYEVAVKELKNSELNNHCGALDGSSCSNNDNNDNENSTAMLKEATVMKLLEHENIVQCLGYTSVTPTSLNNNTTLSLVLEMMPKGDLCRYLRSRKMALLQSSNHPMGSDARPENNVGDISNQSKFLEQQPLLTNPNTPPDETCTTSTTTPNEIPFQERAWYAFNIARGMAYLHNKGIIHCDLAARNCMLSFSNDSSYGFNIVKLSDFGLSKKPRDGSDYYAIDGGDVVPLAWMAPESLKDRKYTFATDVWSYGITIWEVMSNGDRPYGQYNSWTIASKIDGGERLPLPEGCSQKFFSQLQKCWSDDREERPTFKTLELIMAQIFVDSYNSNLKFDDTDAGKLHVVMNNNQIELQEAQHQQLHLDVLMDENAYAIL